MIKFQINTQSKDMHIVVGRSFIRVVKNHHFYDVFKKTFNKMVKTKSGENNPFGRFDSFDTLMANIKTYTQSQSPHCHDEYEFITMMINHMLHFFLERGGVDPRRLGMFGQEIFDIACYALYGDKYLTDMESLNHSAPRPRNDFEAHLVGTFMKYKQDGGDLDWDEFLQHFARKFDRSQFDETAYRDNRHAENEYDDDDTYEEDYEDEDDYPW